MSNPVEGSEKVGTTRISNPVVIGGQSHVSTFPAAAANGQVTSLMTDAYGRLITSGNAAYAVADAVATGPRAVVISAAAGAEFTLVPAPGAGLSLHITHLFFSESSNSLHRCALRQGTGAANDRAAFWCGRLVGNVVLDYSNDPWKLPAATALIFTSTIATNTVAANILCTINFFTAP